MASSRTVLACSLLLFAGCSWSAEVKKASPAEWGFGVHAVPAFPIGEDGTTSVHPMVGYNYLSFDGGHDNIYQAGAQVRRSLVDKPLWFGGEVAYNRFTSSIDESEYEEDPWNGFSVGGLFGYQLDTSFAPSSFFTSLSFMKFAGQDFEGISGEGWDAWLLRFGYEVQLDLFNR
jgi:hypothetical protein